MTANLYDMVYHASVMNWSNKVNCRCRISRVRWLKDGTFWMAVR